MQCSVHKCIKSWKVQQQLATDKLMVSVTVVTVEAAVGVLPLTVQSGTTCGTETLKEHGLLGGEAGIESTNNGWSRRAGRRRRV
jgi:hypothetical protein